MFTSPPQGQPVDLKSESNLTSKQNIPPLPIEEGMYINFSCFILDQSVSTSPPQGQLGVKSEGNLRPGQNVPLPPSEGMVQILSYIIARISLSSHPHHKVNWLISHLKAT